METSLLILLGWPAALIGFALLVAGVLLRRTWLAALGAALTSGLCLYVALYPPPVGWLALASLASNGLCPFAIRRRRHALAWVCLLPFPVSASLLAIMIRSS